MVCPKCGKDMVSGNLPTASGCLYFEALNRDSLKFNPKAKESPVIGYYLQLTKYPVIRKQRAESFYCATCNFIITPVKEL